MTSAESPMNLTKLPRRRNGKEQACEPCRKGKMRCDHSLPVCQNCRRRNLTEKCVYVEAPQTRPKSQRSGSRILAQPQENNVYAQSQSFRTSSIELSPGVSRDEDFEGEASIFRPSSGFFGPTSFSAVYNENDLGPDIESPQDQSPRQISAENERHEEEMSARTSLGAKVLNQLPNQATCDRCFEAYAAKGLEKSFHKPTVLYCMSSLWANFGQALRQPRKAKDLREMAQLFSRNTMSVLRDTDDPEVWLQSLSGRNLRWEMIGIFFCALGNVLLATPDEDPFWSSQSGRRMNRKEFSLEMKECVDQCVKLSNQMDNINMLMISLLFKRNIFESQCTGDTSLMLWRQHGDLNNAVTGLGLHRDRDVNSPPTICSEMRRRIWSVTFSIDKTIAAFTGRPPGLSHRFDQCPLLLDLSDEALLAPKEERERAIALLDPNGWNTAGEVNPATSCRATMIISVIMSEILEISLGAESQYSDARVLDLKLRNDQVYSSFPSWLHLTKELPLSNMLQWIRFVLRLRWLHCCLLLEQLLVKRSHTNQQHLLDIAREMLELTVYMWVERDRFVERHYDYDWMIMCYGIPASGVVCVELLRQMKQPRSTHLRIPRSEVIQNLSLLVGFLDWVRPTAANRELCGRMSVIIKRILDQLLDPPPMNDGPDPSSSELAPMQDFDFGQIDTGEFDWLGTVDWTHGPFVDLGTDGFNQIS